MGCYILQNKNRQTIRTFLWDSTSMTLVYRQDQGRIEAVANTKNLDEQEVPYSILLETTKQDVQKKDISIGAFGYLSYKENPTVFSPNFDLQEEETILKKSMQYSALTLLGLIALLMLISFVANRFFNKQEIEPVVVTIQTPQKIEEFLPKKKIETVKPSDKIIKKVTPVQEVKKSTVTRKIQPKKVTVAKNIPIRKDVPVNRKGPNIHQMGVLGALTAAKKNAAHSLDTNGNGVGGRGSGGQGYGSYGNGGGGLGEGLKGGATGALPGKGLLASSPGAGSQAMGAGGYGSSGNGGGRHSIGSGVSFRGQSGAFMSPLTEEASVESGLDRDQIAAVVQKNMGQIIYCYEMGLQSQPDLKGRLTANWIINARGLVNTSQIAHSSVGDEKVEKCISSKIKNWKFPKPVGGVNVDVNYPFELRRVSQR